MSTRRVVRTVRLAGLVAAVVAVTFESRGDDGRCDGTSPSPQRPCRPPDFNAVPEPNSCAQGFPFVSAEKCGQYYDWTAAQITPGCDGPRNQNQSKCIAFGTATGAGWVPTVVYCGAKFQCAKDPADGICSSSGATPEDVNTLKFGSTACLPDPLPVE